MRKIFFILLSSFLVISCEKNNSSINLSEQTLINKSIISQLINLPESEQKIAYRLLNNHEMAYLWNDKFMKIKKTESFNKEQESFINYLLSIIKPDLFVINSQSNIEFRSTIGKNISARAKNLFGFENATFLLTSLNKRPINPNLVIDDENLIKKCKCSSESNYCDPLASCNENPETICRHTTLGCGALLMYSCNGLCSPL